MFPEDKVCRRLELCMGGVSDRWWLGRVGGYVGVLCVILQGVGGREISEYYVVQINNLPPMLHNLSVYRVTYPETGEFGLFLDSCQIIYNLVRNDKKNQDDI